MLYDNDPTHRKVLEENRTVHRLESQFYDEMHTEIYNPDENADLMRDLEAIHGRLADKTDVAMLDVGCGTGNITLRFCRDRRFHITALDISEEMLDCLTRKIPADAAVRTVLSSVEEFLDRTDEQYDLVSINSVLHHLFDPYAVFAVLLERLNPGGILFAAHEPLHRSQRNAGAAARGINGLDKLLSRIVRLWRRPCPRIDHTWSDYQREGIDLQRLKSLLPPSDYNVQCSLSAVYRTRAAAAINRRWPNAVNTFRLVACRKR